MPAPYEHGLRAVEGRHLHGAGTLGRVDDETQWPLPAQDADALAWLLFEQDGVLSSRQSIRHLSVGAVRHRVESGRWQRPWRGVLAAHSGPLTARQRQWVALLAAGPAAVLAGITAARAWGLRAGNDRCVHLLVGPGHQPHRLPAGMRLHRSVSLGAEVRGGLRPPRTGLARSLVDAASWARTDDDARGCACRRLPATVGGGRSG